MAVKQKKRKANFKKNLLKVATKIKCCYCLRANECIYKVRKEKSEDMGCITYCTLAVKTPKTSKKKSNRK